MTLVRAFGLLRTRSGRFKVVLFDFDVFSDAFGAESEYFSARRWIQFLRHRLTRLRRVGHQFLIGLVHLSY